MSRLANVKLHLVNDLDSAREFLEWGRRVTDQPIGCDTESSGFYWHRDDYVRMVQVGDGEHGWAMRWDRWSGLFEAFMKTHTGPIDMMNSKFDYAFLRKAGVELDRPRIRDVGVMSHVLEPHLSRALKNQAKRHVDPQANALQWKLDEALGAHGGWTWATVPHDFQPYWAYAALDPVLTYLLREHHLPLVQEQAPAAYELENAFQWVALGMETLGTPVDVEYAQQHYTKFTAYCAEVEKWCQTEYGVKPGSNAAVIKILQEAGFEFSKATASGAVALDKDVLEAIDHPLAQAVLRRRQLQKIASTYLRHYIDNVDSNGRIHPSINTLGARTSRMSMAEPNFQNLPVRGGNPAIRVVRNCVRARPGYTLVFSDFDQVEMRGLAIMSGDPGLIAAFRSPEDFFVNLARNIYQDNSIEKSDPRRQVTKNCVPIDTQILTKRGWLKHDEVQVGDYTLGIDTKTRKMRWTEIQAIHHYNDAEVVNLGNKQKSFETTLEHRWLAEHERTKQLKFITTAEQPKSPYRVLLAAEAEDGVGDVTPHEAAVLGWVLSDGSIIRSEFVGATSQANGRKVKCSLIISQVKPHRVAEIDQLLRDVPHKRYSRDRNGKTSVGWIIASEWGRSVLERAGIHNKQTFDPWQVALSLSTEARQAMIETLNAGDGGDFKHGSVRIRQLDGCPVAELVVALGFLTGNFPRTYVFEPNGKNWQRSTCVEIMYQKPRLTGQRTQVTPIGKRDVWCVTTELGTWTALQGRVPFITGNSGYAKIYGAGISKLAQTAGITQQQAAWVMQTFDAAYPRVSEFAQATFTEAMQNLHSGGVSYVTCPLTGRHHVADRGKEYALLNYRIQGWAAALFKTKLLEADAAGLGEFMILPIHDEIALEVPNDQLRDVVHTLRKCMNDDEQFPVPISASVATGERWGEKREWSEDE